MIHKVYCGKPDPIDSTDIVAFRFYPDGKFVLTSLQMINFMVTASVTTIMVYSHILSLPAFFFAVISFLLSVQYYFSRRSLALHISPTVIEWNGERISSLDIEEICFQQAHLSLFQKYLAMWHVADIDVYFITFRSKSDHLAVPLRLTKTTAENCVWLFMKITRQGGRIIPVVKVKKKTALGGQLFVSAE